MARAMTDAELYEADFYAWTKVQADKLRRLEVARANLDLDLPRLAEEVEDLGKSESRAVLSQLGRIIEHCLKLEFAAAEGPRAGWMDSIDDAREQLSGTLTPTLWAQAEEQLPQVYARAQRRTSRSLVRYGEAAAANALPAVNPYALDALLDDDWYPASRHGLTE